MLPNKLHPVKPTDNKTAVTVISGSKQEQALLPNYLLSHMKKRFRLTQHVAPLTQLSIYWSGFTGSPHLTITTILSWYTADIFIVFSPEALPEHREEAIRKRLSGCLRLIFLSAHFSHR